jgi:hypothetical protein
MKRNKMKKIVALVAVLFSVVVPVQAEANDKSLVIIDSYFQSNIASNPINATGKPCAQVTKPVKGATASSPYNHGTIMYAVAKLQNPTLPIIPICASSAQSDVFPDQLIASLNWVKTNSTKVSAVSISLTFNKTRTECMPANPVKKLESAKDLEIRALIKSLSDLGVPVFAAAGNETNKSYSYPGCIADTFSVVHADNLGRGMVPWANTSNTDYFIKLSDDGSKFNYNSPLVGLVAQTSSSSTAAAAAMWATNRVGVGVVKPTI